MQAAKSTPECKYDPSSSEVPNKRSIATDMLSSTAVLPRADAAVGLRRSNGYDIFAACSTTFRNIPTDT